MTIEKIDIDEKYTFQIEDGHVQILRNGEPWVGQEKGGFTASKAWISAAYLIEELRNENAALKVQLDPATALNGDEGLRTLVQQFDSEDLSAYDKGTLEKVADMAGTIAGKMLKEAGN